MSAAGGRFRRPRRQALRQRDRVAPADDGQRHDLADVARCRDADLHLRTRLQEPPAQRLLDQHDAVLRAEAPRLERAALLLAADAAHPDDAAGRYVADAQLAEARAPLAPLLAAE